MAKVTELPEVVAPVGDEPVIIISGGRAKRTRFDRLATIITSAAIAARDLAQGYAQSCSEAVTATANDRAIVATARNDVTAKTADVTARAADVTAKAANALASANLAAAAVNATGFNGLYRSKAEANTAFASLPNGFAVDVYNDESRGMGVTRYMKVPGQSAWVFVKDLSARLELFIDSDFGNDAWSGLSPQEPLKTIAAAVARAGGIFLSGPFAFTGIGPSPRAILWLSRGSEWSRAGLNSLPPFCEVRDYGQGHKPRITAAYKLPRAGWTYSATYDAWFLDDILPVPIAGGWPGANAFHAGMWYRLGRQPFRECGLPRIFNGDPMPDASYDPKKPQTTTIAVTTQTALLNILKNSPRGGFTFFVLGSADSAVEPRSAANAGVTAIRRWVRLPDGSSPNAASDRDIWANAMEGCGDVSQGCDVHNVVFACSGNKDMVSGYGNSSGPATFINIGSGSFHGCEFEEAGCHGPVAGGMNFLWCIYWGSTYRGGYKFAGGAFHNFRQETNFGASRGYRVEHCEIYCAGIGVYSHGSGSGGAEHRRAVVRHTRFNDVNAMIAGGTNQQGPLLEYCTGTEIDAVGELSDGRMYKCDVTGRAGAQVTALVVRPGYVGTLEDTTVRAGAGGSIRIAIGPLSEVSAATWPTTRLVNSKVLGRILDPGNASFCQANLDVDGTSVAGPFEIQNAPTDVFLRGFLNAKAGARILCTTTSIETLRATYPGIEAGVETGIRRQVWSKSITLADISFVALQGVTISYTGSGTTLQSSYNYSPATVGRFIKIVGGGAGGTDFLTRVVNVPDLYTIIVADAPPAAFANKAVQTAVLAREPYKNAVAAYVSRDGTQLNVPDGTLLMVGMMINVGQVRASKPAFGLRRIASIAGNILTLDQPIVWATKTNLQYNDIATPLAPENYAPLPAVSLSWRYSFTPPYGYGFSPTYSIAKVEGGTISDSLTFKNVGVVDYERGFITPNALKVAIGDVVTFTNEIEIPELSAIAA